jgi:hypothetical protein
MKMGTQLGRVVALVLLLLAVLAGSTCQDPTGVQLDITGISGQPLSQGVPPHFHRCTIPGRDITLAPPEGRTYPSTTDNGHSHEVFLSGTQLLDLQQPNAALSVDSKTTGSNHEHSFLFEH